jgi:hypothetical protein
MHPLGVLPAGDQHGPIAVARGAAENSLYGIDLRSGRLQWSCPDPIRLSTNGSVICDEIRLLGGPSDAMLVYFRHGAVSLCREGILHDAGALPERDRHPDPPIPSFAATSLDPRLARDLPWNLSRRTDDGQTAPGPGWIAWGAVYAMVWMVVPGLYGRWLVRDRIVNLRRLRILPVVVGLILTGIMVGPSPSPVHLPGKILLAVACLPVLIAPVLFARWLAARRIGVVGFWIAFATIAAALLAVWSLRQAKVAFDPMLPEERYSPEGWYWILVLGAYVAGWAILVVGVLQRLASLLWKVARAGRQPLGQAP